jgi:hypothetical protein
VGRDRAGADNPPAAPLVDHLPRRSLVAVEDAVEVHRHRAPPLLHGGLDQWCRDGDAGVRDNDVEPAELVHVGLHGVVDLSRIGHVNGDGQDRVRSAERGSQLDQQRGRRGKVGDRHRKPVRAESFRDGLADPLCGSRHQGAASVLHHTLNRSRCTRLSALCSSEQL